MDWLLILTLTMGGEQAVMPVGQMADKRTCTIAGAGMAQILEAANPGLAVAFTCLAGDSA